MKTPPRPRLALPGSLPPRNRKRQLRRIEAWARDFRGRWPEDVPRPVVHWHLPADQRLVDPPDAVRDDQRRCAEALILAGTHLRAARPTRRCHQRIYVALFWPHLFMSECGVFLDPAYGDTFATRNSAMETWTPLAAEDRSLSRELGFAVPAGFREHGYAIARMDEEGGAHHSEIWLLRETD